VRRRAPGPGERAREQPANLRSGDQRPGGPLLTASVAGGVIEFPTLQSLQSKTSNRDWAAEALLIALLGLLDYVTGVEISFSIFYLIPVALLAWFVGRGAGLAATVASALTWLLANRMAGETYSGPLVPLWNMTTRACFFAVVGLLLSSLRAVLDHERHMARTDDLTGVANTRAFYELAEMELRRARRYGRPFTLAYVDVDDFKNVNDSGGHLAGDALLRTIAATLRHGVRGTDTVARMGGDEFALLLPETDEEAGARVIGLLRERIKQATDASAWRITVSAGVITCLVPPDSVDDLLRAADAAMYSVKSEGKNGLRQQVLTAGSGGRR
jgi:diguanylate cyclase (GGDEF)-like protein